jgi:predicted nicotinamide N-methyase
VLDVGSGSGACAIAAMISGALNATANDIDPGILKLRQLCKICVSSSK